MFMLFLFGDVSNMFAYILTFFILLLMYQNPLIHPTLYRLVCENLLDRLHPEYLPPEMMTETEYDLQKLSMSLQKLMKIEGSEVKIDKDFDKDDDDKEGLYQKIRQMKK
jgi:hypothetical protein